MIRKLVVGIVTLAVVLAAIGFLLPRKVKVTRSIVIDAPASSIFAVVDGFRQFDQWSPWSEKDPNLKVERSGPLFGVGAAYAWTGNDKVGSGTQEIVDSKPYSQVTTRLTFGGFDQPSTAVFLLEPASSQGTRISWTLDTDLGVNPVWHYFGLFMDKMVGADYERGLARLKRFVEARPRTDFGTLQAELVQAPVQTIAYVSGTSSTDIAEIGKALEAAYAKVSVGVQAAGLKVEGAPLAITRRYDDEAKVFEFDAGIPVEKSDAQPPDGSPVKLKQLYTGTALKVEHKGAYAQLPQTYDLLAAFKRAHQLEDNGESWEQYVSDPGSTPEADLLTLIFVPVK